MNYQLKESITGSKNECLPERPGPSAYLPGGVSPPGLGRQRRERRSRRPGGESDNGEEKLEGRELESAETGEARPRDRDLEKQQREADRQNRLDSFSAEPGW